MQTFRTSKAKENILRKVRTALQEEALPLPFPEIEKTKVEALFTGFSDGTPEEHFAASFTNAGGHFVFCNTQEDLLQNLKVLAESRGWTEVLCAHKPLFSYLVNNKIAFVREFNVTHDYAQACITDCEAAVARTGSFFLSSHQNHGRVAPVYFPVHIVVLQAHQIVDDISDGLQFLKRKYNDQLPSMINLNTGPSRTADIEKTLVVGVHGPGEVYVFLIDR